MCRIAKLKQPQYLFTNANIVSQLRQPFLLTGLVKKLQIPLVTKNLLGAESPTRRHFFLLKVLEPGLEV
jgi:hypothetical protein